MRSVETEGGTIDEAIDRALELLHIERDKVDIEIVENASRGLLGFGGKRARIRARVRNPLSAPSPASNTPVSQETRADGPSATAARDPDASIAGARDTLAEILRQLGVEPSVEIERNGDDSWCFRMPASGSGIVIGRHGQTLDAIEYLLNRIAGRAGSAPIRITVDVEGYRERRQDSVEQVARRAADQARQTGRPVMLPPMSPRDRRTVHVALTDERGVTTRSEGEGSTRRVVVVPNRSSGRPSS
jgi:spoIIIJ-associated protein